MSTNIKLNPYFLAGKWNVGTLEMLISHFGTSPPTVNAIATQMAPWINYTYLLPSTETSYLKRAPIFDIVANTINDLTQNSWCKDCCNNTFSSYETVKAKIQEMDVFSPEQLNYINQMIAMPCNYNIVNIEHFEGILNQLETNILIDQELSQNDKNPLLLFLSISIANFKYWKIQTDNPVMSPWGPLFTPLAPGDYFRSFWLAGLLGTIISVEREIQKAYDTLSEECINISILGFVGASASSSVYAYYK
jgi:hypothetical protein